MAARISHEASPSTSRMSIEDLMISHGFEPGTSYHRLLKDTLRKVSRTFRDGDVLERGENIMLQLHKAIERSRVSTIILPVDYEKATTWWPTKLADFLECRSSRHPVIRFFNYWMMALKEVANLTGLEFSNIMFEVDKSHISQRVCHPKITIVLKNNRADLSSKCWCFEYASLLKDERTRGKRSRDEISSQVFSLDILQQHFGNKREDVAKRLGISISTLKRYCRYHGISRWPNRIRINVSGLPIPYGEKNPLPTFNTLSTNGQMQMENEVGGQNLEPDECPPDSFEDPNFWSTRIGSIAEFDKTPTLSDSVPDHCRVANFCISAAYSETEAAGGSSESVFQLQGQTTQSTAYSNRNVPVCPHPQIAPEEVNENGGSSEAALYQTPATMPNELPRNYFDDPSFWNTEHDSIVPTTQFPACPTPSVSPLQIAPTEVLSGNMGSLFASLAALLEGPVFESDNLTVPPCPDAAAPSRLLANNIHIMPTYPRMVPHLIGGSSESTYPNHSGLVDPPHPQRASTQIPSENMRTLEDLSESINPTIPSCSNPTPSQQLMMPPLIASQDTNSVRVKATNGIKTIAFYLSFASGIIQLKEEISKRSGFELGNFNLQYEDADGDLVSIACDDDVRDYLQLLTSNPVSKLLVS